MSKKNPFPRYEEEGEVQHLRAQVRDLKARLKALVPHLSAAVFYGVADRDVYRITDLRRNWRKP